MKPASDGRTPGPRPRAGQVSTVTGPIDPDALGFTLPHEHTAISLWWIENRWDYWELTPDDGIVRAELERFRDRGGTCLTDLTLPGVGRDPERLRALSERTGLAIVMGGGWYRDAYYPVEARIDRRSADDLADELIGEFENGVGGTGVRPQLCSRLEITQPPRCAFGSCQKGARASATARC